jgi:putative ABC transport system permease protein
MGFLLDSALLGLEYGLLALGVFITFRILNLPDLTVDGSFAFGMAVSTVLCAQGHPFLGLGAGFLAGALAGMVTAFLQTACKIHPILAGILTMSGLYTVNITVLGGPNVSLLGAVRFYELMGGQAVAVIALTVVVLALVAVFFQTVAGLCIRAARSSSINPTAVRFAALMLANALVALSGAILAQCQGYGDVGAGSGMIVVGLASVIIGEVIFSRRGVVLGLVSAVLGSVVYRIILALALRYNLMSANALRLLSAVIIAATLAVPAVSAALRERRKRKENRPC